MTEALGLVGVSGSTLPDGPRTGSTDGLVVTTRLRRVLLGADGADEQERDSEDAEQVEGGHPRRARRRRPP